VIPLTRAIPERIRGGLRRCAIQIDVYLLTLLLRAQRSVTSMGSLYGLPLPLPYGCLKSNLCAGFFKTCRLQNLASSTDTNAGQELSFATTASPRWFRSTSTSSVSTQNTTVPGITIASSADSWLQIISLSASLLAIFVISVAVVFFRRKCLSSNNGK